MKQSRGSKVETEARPCEAEPAKKRPRAEADASRTTSLLFLQLTYHGNILYVHCGLVPLKGSRTRTDVSITDVIGPQCAYPRRDGQAEFC